MTDIFSNYRKATKVVHSCETLEQLKAARKYTYNFFLSYSTPVSYTLFTRLIRKIFKRTYVEYTVPDGVIFHMYEELNAMVENKSKQLKRK